MDWGYYKALWLFCQKRILHTSFRELLRSKVF